MIDVNRLKKDLGNIYGEEKIAFYAKDEPHRENVIYLDKKTTIKYKLKKGDNLKKDFVILVNENVNYEIAIIWDNTERKKDNELIESFSMNKYTWDTLLPDGEVCRQDYIKKYKVVIMKLEMLDYYKYDLYDIVTPSSDDNSIPEEYLNEERFLEERKRNTYSRAERYYKFRKIILKHFNCKCVVCGCDIEEVLEAAHIIAVEDGGKDILENGICLCANHHRMFDKHLIGFDAKTKKMNFVSQRVKKWC